MLLSRPFLIDAVALWLLRFVLGAAATGLFGDNPVLRITNAIALVFFLRWSPRHWLVLFPIAWSASVAARLLTHTAAPLMAPLWGTLEPLLIAAVIHWSGGLPQPWYRSRELPRLVGTSLLVPVFIAVVGARALHPFGPGFAHAWWTWYSASALGYLVLNPVLLSWADPKIRGSALRVAQRSTAVPLLLGTVCAAALMLQNVYAPLVLLAFPLIAMVTWAYGLLGATLLLAAVFLAGTWSVVADQGAIHGMVPTDLGLLERMQALQILLLSLVITALPLAALLQYQRALNQKLRRSNEARSEFLAAMSHEIRTPMTGVLGLADLLASEDLNPKQQRYVQTIRGSGRHLLAVINDILDFSRIETGKLPLERIDFSLPDVLEQVRSLVHPMAVEKNVGLRVELSQHSPPIVRGDPTRLKQILLNLVNNAIKFTARGEVALLVDAEAPVEGQVRLRFEVHDTGTGIAPEKLQQIFEPFTQADQSTVRRYGGSGLGLAISRRLAEAMGGHLQATSTLGQGSVFSVDLVLGLGDEARLVREAGEVALAIAPRRILVAEDVEVNREILRASLGRHGHMLDFAHNGAEAVDKVQQADYDLVLMDVQMPVMDGVEATRRIRALPGPKGDLPIIGLTANVMAQEQERYLAAGMDECQIKPIDWPRLAAAIARHGGGGLLPEEAALAGPQAVSAPSAGPPAEPPSDPPAAAASVLIDDAQLASLQAVTSGEELAMLMAAGIEEVRNTYGKLLACEGPDCAAAQGHRLKGSAGSLGLLRVSELAGRIERAGNAGEPVEALGAELGTAIEATAQALAQRGLLDAPASTPSLPVQ